MAKESREKIKEIQTAGHEIGLHFDELNYKKNIVGVKPLIFQEIGILEEILQTDIKSVSMHRPSK